MKQAEADEVRFGAGRIEASIDLGVGHISSLTIEADGRTLEPLHRAPWVDDAQERFPDDAPPNVRRLSGDFLCAPFGRNDLEAAPSHGWPANSRWIVVDNAALPDGWRVRLRLERTVQGAIVEKVLTLRNDHPFLYSEHRFIGGEGRLSAAHHTMVRMEQGGVLAFSPKRFAETLDDPLEPDPARGRFALAYPAKTVDLTRFPLHGGGFADLHVYPPAEAHEDFLTLAERGNGVGWTLVSRNAERDCIAVLKNAADLPVTMLWMSNGGRDYAPWSSRHRGVLGIEDGRASGLGHKGSLGDNGLRREGIETSFSLKPDGVVGFRQAIGAFPIAEAGVFAQSLAPKRGGMTINLSNGAVIEAPFDSDFLAKPLI